MSPDEITLEWLAVEHHRIHLMERWAVNRRDLSTQQTRPVNRRKRRWGGLSVKGFAKVSIADLRSTAGVDYRFLHKAFGTREAILRAAIRFCADTKAALAHEPFRISATGKEAYSPLEVLGFP
jgi:hypothetical protein